MRVGLMIGSDKERSRSERVAGLIDDALEADRAGFTSLWLPQIPGHASAEAADSSAGRGVEHALVPGADPAAAGGLEARLRALPQQVPPRGRRRRHTCRTSARPEAVEVSIDSRRDGKTA